MNYKKICIIIAIFISITNAATPQSNKLTGSEANYVPTAVPFLTIAPDSRGAAMGDAGVATSPDANSQFWNPAKYAFIKDEAGLSISYLPWLRNLVPDINMAYLTGYYKIDREQTISGSLKYFALGQIIFKDQFNVDMGMANPNEFAVDVAYSRLFSEKVSGAISFRSIRSDFGKAYLSSGESTKAGIAFAADVAAFYNDKIQIEDKDATLAFGLNISNIGSKISYTDGQNKDFIPINLRLGSALTIAIDPYNEMTFALDVNKLLVPTPPIYNDSVQRTILYGMDPDVSVAMGMLQSFYDAPGGYKEELREIMYSGGVEYLYMKQFAVRAGYFHEHTLKGNRKYATMGIGLNYNIMSFDFAYMIPKGRTNPLANTVRFTIGFNLGKMSK